MSRVPALATLALCLSGLAAIPAAAGGRSIVGRWGVTADECVGTAAFVIAPQAIASDEMSCVLPGVSRVGDTVTFKGRCENIGEEPAPETVIATLRGERLDMRFLKGGATYNGLIRCRGGR